MLRRIDVKDSWRCLDNGFWPDSVPLGSRTVIYGHNGSGKSTLSELLLTLSEGNCPTGTVWESEHQQRTDIKGESANPPIPMAVFTRRWVEANLAAFLDGDSASAIVTLGREAIYAKEEEERLVVEIDKLTAEASEAEKKHGLASEEVERLTREVQDQIVTDLKEFDFNHFTKNRYSVNKVQDDLRTYRGDKINSDTRAEALTRLREGTPIALAGVGEPPESATGQPTDLSELLEETPTRVAIETLDGDPRTQAWVEEGLGLHNDLDNCLFCDSAMTQERRTQLARHFDESWLRIRGRAQDQLALVESERQALIAWKNDLPRAESLASELQSEYTQALKQTESDVDERVATLKAIEAALAEKAGDPGATPEALNYSALAGLPPTEVLVRKVKEHNEQVRRHEEVTDQRKQTVLDYLVGSRSHDFCELEKQTRICDASLATIKNALQHAERQLDAVRQAQFTTKDMAETLSQDLARVYGKNHLSVAVTADGKSYACRRGDKPGTDLSDGERTTLSLLYFLRKLEDEQLLGGDPKQRIVIIDDPSSSLDREALFATHQWLIDTLEGYGQYIILTHDFGLLRLFIKSHRNKWTKSMKKLGDSDADEQRFPSVSFLEMYMASVEGERRSRVGRLPRVLLNNTSEYAYLFTMVMAGITDSADHERLFLLPNAARRLLEVFASYKAPHRTDFRQQLEALVPTQDPEPFRDVYDFCNRFSHGEGSESIDVLDARSIHHQIRRCMQFLKAADSEHFSRMCDATGTDESVL